MMHFPKPPIFPVALLVVLALAAFAISTQERAAPSDQAVSMHEWVELKVKSLEERVTAHFEANDRARDVIAESNEKALRTASEALTIRLESHNGLLAKLDKQQADAALAIAALRSEFVQKVEFGQIEKRIALLENSDAITAGRGQGNQTLRDLMLVVVGAIVAFALSAVGRKLSTPPNTTTVTKTGPS